VNKGQIQAQMRPWLVFALTELVLLTCAFAARNGSASLVSPLPRTWVAVGIALWLGLSLFLIRLLQGAARLPRIVKRLLVIAALAAGGWSLGTMARATYVLVSFAGETTQPRPVVGMVLGMASPADDAFPVSAPELRKSWTLPFTPEAAARARRRFTCVRLTLEQTATGVVRLVSRAPIGATDFVDCPVGTKR
jgi:hypothetical protein